MGQTDAQSGNEQIAAGTIQVQINGEVQPVDQGSTCADIIEQRSAGGGKRFAVERNEQMVPRSQLACVVLEEGDRIEIIQAIGGG